MSTEEESSQLIRLKHSIRIQAPTGRCFDLARSIEVHLLNNVHCGAQALARGPKTRGLIEPGEAVTWRARHFYIWHELTWKVTAFQPPVYFQNVMTDGIFQSMQHGHYFSCLPSGGTEMQDCLQVTAPFGLMGRIAEVLFLRRYMYQLLQERANVIKKVAENADWKRYLPEGGDQ